MKVPVFESIEMAARTLDKMCTYKEYLLKQESVKKELILNSLLPENT